MFFEHKRLYDAFVFQKDAHPVQPGTLMMFRLLRPLQPTNLRADETRAANSASNPRFPEGSWWVYFSRLWSLAISEDHPALADSKRVAVDSIIRLESSMADRARSGQISTKAESVAIS
jgi:hypothetical protein